MGIWKSEPHLSTGKHRILCDDGDQVVGLKVEEVTVIKVEVEPEPVKVEEVTVIKVEVEPEPVKVEEVTVIKEEEDPKPTPLMEIKNEPAVSCMSLCL